MKDELIYNGIGKSFSYRKLKPSTNYKFQLEAINSDNQFLDKKISELKTPFESKFNLNFSAKK